MSTSSGAPTVARPSRLDRRFVVSSLHTYPGRACGGRRRSTQFFQTETTGPYPRPRGHRRTKPATSGRKQSLHHEETGLTLAEVGHELSAADTSVPAAGRETGHSGVAHADASATQAKVIAPFPPRSPGRIRGRQRARRPYGPAPCTPMARRATQMPRPSPRCHSIMSRR
ncbi:hypothetical protein FAIPA1_390022 [Frankia sp. AiPs1]